MTSASTSSYYGLNRSLGYSYELLVDGVSACTARVTYYLAVYFERGGQMFCLHPLYISFNGIKYSPLFVE